MNDTLLHKLMLLLAVTSFFSGCHSSAVSPSGELTTGMTHVRINHPAGNKEPIPQGDKLTIVNVFDAFSTGCATGNRFETMQHLNSLHSNGTTMLLIFSDQQFSIQDMENFKALLPMAELLVQGNIEAIRPYLTNGKLLVVLDSNGSVIWHEKPDMSEQQVFSEISKLIQAAGKIS